MCKHNDYDYDNGIECATCRKKRTAEFSLDWPHGYQTRKGDPVEYLGKRRYGDEPLVFKGFNDILILRGSNGKRVHVDGEGTKDAGTDIINKPAPRLSDTPYRPDHRFNATRDEFGKKGFTTSGSCVNFLRFNEQETRDLYAWLGDLLK